MAPPWRSDGGATSAASERGSPAGSYVPAKVDIVIEVPAENVVHGRGVADVSDKLTLGHLVLDVR